MYAIGRNQHQTDNSWPNVVAFAFKKDNVAKLDGVKPGVRVKVGFAVDGREWTDPKTGKARNFSDLTALRLEQLDGALQVPEPAVPDNLSGIKGVENGWTLDYAECGGRRADDAAVLPFGACGDLRAGYAAVLYICRLRPDSRVLCFSCPVRDYVASARAALAIAGESVE